jgi:hypothetical protein
VVDGKKMPSFDRPFSSIVPPETEMNSEGLAPRIASDTPEVVGTSMIPSSRRAVRDCRMSGALPTVNDGGRVEIAAQGGGERAPASHHPVGGRAVDEVDSVAQAVGINEVVASV